MDVETNGKKVTYSIVDSYHSLCLDKKDIIYVEIEASDTLPNNAQRSCKEFRPRTDWTFHVKKNPDILTSSVLV
jgi:hypothetical protein